LSLHNVGLIFIQNRKIGQPFVYGIMLRNIPISIAKLYLFPARKPNNVFGWLNQPYPAMVEQW